MMQQHINNYIGKLSYALNLEAMNQIEILGQSLLEAWREGRAIYICGNGGSAGNAMHLANDFLYGIGVNNDGGLRAEALSANTAVITCLANDIGYDHIFEEQLKVKALPNDILIALSGSGNSINVVKAIEFGNTKGMKTFAILGYTGGRCKEVVQFPIHFDVDDMQIAEDLQLITGHICAQWLCKEGKN